MPYIKREARGTLDEHLRPLACQISTPGELNYAICHMARQLAHYMGNNYAAHNTVMGAIDCASREYYRRVIAPYEDTKITENGDVF